MIRSHSCKILFAGCSNQKNGTVITNKTNKTNLIHDYFKIIKYRKEKVFKSDYLYVCVFTKLCAIFLDVFLFA